MYAHVCYTAQNKWRMFYKNSNKVLGDWHNTDKYFYILMELFLAQETAHGNTKLRFNVVSLSTNILRASSFIASFIQ